jgi:hypothetical protein
MRDFFEKTLFGFGFPATPRISQNFCSLARRFGLIGNKKQKKKRRRKNLRQVSFDLRIEFGSLY